MASAAVDGLFSELAKLADTTGCLVPNPGGVVTPQLKRFVLRTKPGALSELFGYGYSYEVMDERLDSIGVLIRKNGGCSGGSDSSGMENPSLLRDDTAITERQLDSFELSRNRKLKFTIDESIRTRNTESEIKASLVLKEFGDTNLHNLRTELENYWGFSEKWTRDLPERLQGNKELCFISGIVMTENGVDLIVKNDVSWGVYLKNFFKLATAALPLVNAAVAVFRSAITLLTNSSANLSEENTTTVKRKILANSVVAYRVVPLTVNSDGSISYPILTKASPGDEQKINTSDEIIQCKRHYEDFEDLSKDIKDTVRKALTTTLQGLDSKKSEEQLYELLKLATDDIDNLLTKLGVSNLPDKDAFAKGIHNFITALIELPADALQELFQCATDAERGLAVVKELEKMIECQETKSEYPVPAEVNVASFIAMAISCHRDCSLYAWRVAYVAAIHMFAD